MALVGGAPAPKHFPLQLTDFLHQFLVLQHISSEELRDLLPTFMLAQGMGVSPL